MAHLLQAESPRASSTAVAGAGGATSEPDAGDRYVEHVRSTIDDAVARRARTIVHPTGTGGRLSALHVGKRGDTYVVTIGVDWTGGFTSAAYTTTIVWTFRPSGHVSAAIDRDTAVVHVAADNAKELDAYFAALFTKL
jgi:hypothetical protein